MASASTEQTAEQAPFTRIAIAGLGLIGASLAAALRHAYPGIRLFGADIDERTCEIAVAKGWVDGATAPDAPAFRDFVLQADLAVVATPVDASESILRLLAEWGFEGVITDTASTKAHLAQVASEILPHPHNYVPGHPMAGSEVNGIEGAPRPVQGRVLDPVPRRLDAARAFHAPARAGHWHGRARHRPQARGP